MSPWSTIIVTKTQHTHHSMKDTPATLLRVKSFSIPDSASKELVKRLEAWLHLLRWAVLSQQKLLNICCILSRGWTVVTIWIKSRIPTFLDRKLQGKELPTGDMGQQQQTREPSSPAIPSVALSIHGKRYARRANPHALILGSPLLTYQDKLHQAQEQYFYANGFQKENVWYPSLPGTITRNVSWRQNQLNIQLP